MIAILCYVFGPFLLMLFAHKTVYSRLAARPSGACIHAYKGGWRGVRTVEFLVIDPGKFATFFGKGLFKLFWFLLHGAIC